MADKKPHPVPPEHPYYPRSPYNRWWNDTEPAYSVAPWEGCCDKEDDCVCVTQEEIDKWNEGYSAAATLSGIDWDNISSYSAIEASADLWNDNYNTISSNSATWNNVSGLSSISANLSASANWDKTYKTVSSNSARWNSAVNYSGYINSNASAISALSAAFGSQIKMYFDPNTIAGDGKVGSPYTVRNYQEFIDLLNKVYGGYKQLFNEAGDANWMSVSATTDYENGINPYLKTLFNAINKKDNDQDITLNNHGDLIQWILRHLNPSPQSGGNLIWKEIKAPSSESEASTYNTPGYMFYSFD